jgi:hypothetical protein
MSRNALFVALVAVSIGAGVWVLRSPEDPSVPASGSCDGDAACSVGVAPGLPPSAAERDNAGSTTQRQLPPQPPDESASPPPVEAAPPAAAPTTGGTRPPEPVIPPAPRPAADGKALRAEADRLLAEGRVHEGIEAMRQAAAADPTAKNHGDLGDLLARLTVMDEALVHLRQAADLDPGNADRWIALANAYYRAVNPGEAWKAEKRAKEAEPGLVLGRDKNGRRVRQGDSAPRKP